MKPKPCYCEKYPFPHRKDGGECDATEKENENKDSRPWWKIMEDETGVSANGPINF